MTVQRQDFPARTDMLPQVAAFIERRCAELGVGRQATLRVLLVAEELFINAVTHGYGGDAGKRVRLDVRDKGPEVELVVEDDAAPFNPFSSVPAVPAAADPRLRPLGGLGRALAAGMASQPSYERAGRHNLVTVAVRKRRPGSRG